MKIFLLFIMVFNIAFMEDFFSNWSDESKNIYYQTEKISPEIALLYQFACPLPFCNLGYAYSDNWKNGVRLDAIRIGSLIGVIHFFDDDCSTLDNPIGNLEANPASLCDGRNDELGTLFALSYIGASIAKVVNVYILAEDYNNNLYKKLFGDSRPSFSLNYSNEKKTSNLSLSIPIK